MKQKKNRNIRWIGIVAGIPILGFIIFFVNRPESLDIQRGERVAPVAVSPVKVGSIAQRRTFNGSLESPQSFAVAPKVSGQVIELRADIGDEIEQGALVAVLDNDEFRQAVAQAEAGLKVAEANLVEARNALEIANREYERVQTLRERGVASDAEYDSARAEQLSNTAQLAVAKAQVSRAEASLETAKIRLRYTRVRAEWSAEDSSGGRYVGERFVNEGQSVSANESLMSIVQIRPITGVVFVTERDYARISVGLEVEIRTDAYPDRRFTGKVSRIAPVFRENSRQARVELLLENAEELLKPGMFIRTDVVLETQEDVKIIPYAALTHRNDTPGVFKVNDEGNKVSWHPVKVGIREGSHVSVEGVAEGIKVVTLGHQMLEDGSRVSIPEDQEVIIDRTTGL